MNNLLEKYCSEDWVYLVNERKRERINKRGTLIFKEGEQTEYISFVKKGKVKIFSRLGDKTERIYRFAKDGEIIGHRGIGENFKFPVSAYALTETITIDIPLSLFQSLLKANVLFCYQMMLFFAEELKQSERYMRNIINKDIRQRVAKALKINIRYFGFSKEDKRKLDFTLSRRDISYLAATTYESVIRVLSDFQKEQLIELDGKEIRILDNNKLLAICD